MRIEETFKDKELYKLVRLDTCEDVPGEIVKADEATGDYTIIRTFAGETKAAHFSAGPNGIRIVPKKR